MKEMRKLQAVSTATGRLGVRRTRTWTVRWTTRVSSVAARALNAPRSLPVVPLVTGHVLWATELSSAAPCPPWTATTTPTSAAKHAPLTTPAPKVTSHPKVIWEERVATPHGRECSRLVHFLDTSVPNL